MRSNIEIEKSLMSWKGTGKMFKTGEDIPYFKYPHPRRRGLQYWSKGKVLDIKGDYIYIEATTSGGGIYRKWFISRCMRFTNTKTVTLKKGIGNK